MSWLRPTVQSFDLFDTLIARRCVSPFGIFAEVERALSVPGFAQNRRQAELALAARGAAFDLAAIYAALVAARSLDTATATRCMEAEIECEFDNAVPIMANLSQVGAQDLVVSDMYLPRETLRRLLHHVGLRVPIQLFVSNAGKRGGAIWPLLNEHFLITRHLGDDPESDLASPQRHGIPAAHFTGARPTPLEEELAGAGFVTLARLTRTLRLATPYHADSLEAELWVLATGCNLPLLLLFAAALKRRRAELQRSHLLFSARDCYLLADLFGLLYPTEPAAYFYVSRELLRQSDAKVQRYLDELGLDHALVCDIAATGTSWHRLAQTRPTPIALDTLVFIDNWIDTPCPAAEILSNEHLRLGWQVRSAELAGYSTALEVLNLAPHGTCTGVVGERLLMPRLEDTEEFPPALVRLLLHAHDAALNEVRRQREALRAELQQPAPPTLLRALLDPISRNAQLIQLGERLQWPKSFGPMTR